MVQKIIVLATLVFTTFQTIVAQCPIENTFFENGEVLTYDMYFKLGFTTTRAGKLTLSVDKGSYKGRGDHKMTFQTNTSGIANSIYTVQDTLYAYTSKDIVPQVYIKDAFEGSDYTEEELHYTYKSDGKVDVQTKRKKNGEFRFDEVQTADGCIYDIVSVVYYARTLDFQKMEKGDKTNINFISGRVMSNIEIEYKGSKRVKGNDGKRYDTSELSLKFVAGKEKDKEMMKVFITNDKNRLPIELHTSLKKMGSIKAVIKSQKGLKNVE